MRKKSQDNSNRSKKLVRLLSERLERGSSEACVALRRHASSVVQAEEQGRKEQVKGCNLRGY